MSRPNHSPSLVRFLLVISFLWWGRIITAEAQEVATGQAIQLLLEELPEGEEALQLEETLRQLLAEPLDLNHATEEQLLQLPYFDAFFVRNLLLYRSKAGGRFRSIYDLKAVPGAPISHLPLLAPFLRVGSDRPRMVAPLRQDFYLGSELTLPHRRDRYQGIGVGLRYVGSRQERHSWSLVLGQDRGESWLPLRKGVADHLSFSYQYRQPHWQVLLGDYRLQAGLGVQMGQANSFFSRSEMTGQPPSLSGQLVRPHTSFREEGYLRGVATSWQGGPVQVALFYGFERLDARIEGRRLLTLYPGGMHRTSKEQRYRHTALRSSGGAIVSYQKGKLEVGSTLMGRRYRTAEGQPMVAYRREAKPELNHSASLYFRYLQRHWLLTGETLLAPTNRRATLLSISYFHDHIGRITLSTRYLGADHYSPLGMIESRSSSRRDERGMQLFWSGELARWWTGMVHLDLSQKASVKSGLKPEQWRLTARADYREGRQAFQSRLTFTKRSQLPLRTAFRTTYLCQLSSPLYIRSGLQFTHLSDTPLTWALFGRVRYQPDPQFSLEGGVHYFNATSGVIRADQPYLPWRYYVPMLRGKGLRTTLQTHYHLGHLHAYLRASLTHYQEAPTSLLPSLLEVAFTYRL